MQGKKRKAASQLSPYSNDEDLATHTKTPQLDLPTRKVARAHIEGPVVSYGGKIACMFSGVDLFPDICKKGEDIHSKVSRLNKCFIRSITRVLDTDASKDLTFLFEQYADHLRNIHKSEGDRK